MGGTSTDVALVQELKPRTGRETKIGDLTVRASSVDVRTVGAGGGSIAHVPELTKALRVGPQSAGAEPGPAGYGLGGTATHRHRRERGARLPADFTGRRRDHPGRRCFPGSGADRWPTRWGWPSVEAAAAGIIDIVNENMLGGLRLVSVQQGFDPRDFALVAFGGAGPLHANAMGVLTGAWPVIVPPSPGVLCALGDATTSAARRIGPHCPAPLLRPDLRRTAGHPHRPVRRGGTGLPHRGSRPTSSGSTTRSTSGTSARVSRCRSPSSRSWLEELEGFLPGLGAAFDTEHERLFSFLLGTDHELVNARASVSGPRPEIAAILLPGGQW